MKLSHVTYLSLLGVALAQNNDTGSGDSITDVVASNNSTLSVLGGQ